MNDHDRFRDGNCGRYWADDSSRFHDDERGVSVTVNHTLAIAITTVLIATLLTAVGGMVSDEQEHATSEQLRIVGERMATEVTALDRLVRDGGTVSARVDHRADAGGGYSVELMTDNCPATVSTPNCLRVTSGGTTVNVGVVNETNVSVQRDGPGTFVIRAGDGSDGAASSVGRLPNRVGVVEDVGERVVPHENVNASNRLPIVEFIRFDPAVPTVEDNVTLRANATDLDGDVSTYRWDIDGDGNYSYTGQNKTLPPFDAGTYPVTLQVVDDMGAARTVTKNLSVAGVLYNDDSEALDRNGDRTPGGLGFSVSNEHDGEITITHLFVDPKDDTVDELDSSGTGLSEVVVETSMNDGSASLSDHAIGSGGRIVELDDTATLPSGGDGTIYLSEFGDNDMTEQTITIAVRYRTGGDVYTTRFDVAPDTEAGLTTLVDADFEPFWFWNSLDRHGFVHTGDGTADTIDDEGVDGSGAAYKGGTDGGAGAIALEDPINTERFDRVNVDYWVKEGASDLNAPDPDSGEDLYVQYRAADGSWVTIDRVNATNTAGSTTVRDVEIDDASALHDDFRIRFWQQSADDGDYWIVDQVRVTGRDET